MTARPIALIATALIVIAAPVAADEKVNEQDRFGLWADCGAVGLGVEGPLEDNLHFELTSHAVETAVRSRLRAAGLYDADKFVGLFVANVNVVRHDWLYNEAGKQPFNVLIKYYKLMRDTMSGESNLAVAWHVGTAGLGDPSDILSVVSQKTDTFIDEYLRVNQDACEGRPPAR